VLKAAVDLKPRVRLESGLAEGKGKVEMSRFRIFVGAFFAMLAFGVVMAASASAETYCLETKEGLFVLGTQPDCEEILASLVDDSPFELFEFLLAEWLLELLPIVEPDLVESSSSELTLISLNGGGLGLKVEILCEGILDGTVGPGSEDLITDLLDLSGNLIALELEGSGLTCTNIANCTSPLVWADNLPWPTELELLEWNLGFIYVVLILSNGVGSPGWHAECVIGGVKVTELCTAPEAAFEVSNNAGGTVDALFSEAIQTLSNLKLGTCSIGGAETAEVKGLGTISPVGGGSLTVSSE
jgi:hypothetical protein